MKVLSKEFSENFKERTYHQNELETKDVGLRIGWSLLGRMDRWVTCDFTWFPTACLSYHDDGRVIMKGGCAMKPSLGLKKKSRLRPGSNQGPLDQQASV